MITYMVISTALLNSVLLYEEELVPRHRVLVLASTRAPASTVKTNLVSCFDNF